MDHEVYMRQALAWPGRRRRAARCPWLRHRSGRTGGRPGPHRREEKQSTFPTRRWRPSPGPMSPWAPGGWTIAPLYVTLEPCPMCARAITQRPIPQGVLRSGSGDGACGAY